MQGYKLDPEQRSQLVSVSGAELSLSWFNHLVKELTPALESAIPSAGTREIIWSKHGSYVLCLGQKQMQLRGGPSLALLQTYSHEGIKKAVFSRDEKYIISFNGTVKAANFENYIVWDTITGTRLRAFRASIDQDWGAMQFEGNSRYVSFFSPSSKTVQIYELPTMQLLTSYSKTNLKQIAWCGRGDKTMLLNFCLTADKSKQHCTNIVVSKLTSEGGL